MNGESRIRLAMDRFLKRVSCEPDEICEERERI